MAVITTIEGKCRRCYACVRACPAKSIQVREGQAKVIGSSCIDCGYCVRACSLNAKQVKSGLEKTRKLLSSGKPLTALVSGSFPAAFPFHKYGQVIEAFKTLGFGRVVETAFGANLIKREYIRLMQDEKYPVLISSLCPALVKYIEKYQPDLVKYLAPVVSPMTATARYVKQYLEPDGYIIFIGSCIARKSELLDPQVQTHVDEVLTFDEFEILLEENNVKISDLSESLPEPLPAGLSRIYVLSGGLLRAAEKLIDIADKDVIVSSRPERVLPLLASLSEGNISGKFYDLLLCDSCVAAPKMPNRVSVSARKEIIQQYTGEALKNDPEMELPEIDLSREFLKTPVTLPKPGEKEILDILKSMGKVNSEDQFNCGACGYNTCREEAIAIFQGLAEKEMCMHYLLDRFEEAQEYLIHTEKMTSLGQMAAGVAHELNNPLAGALIYIRLLLKKLGNAGKDIEREDFSSYLSRIEKEIGRCSKIIKNLLDFARQNPPNFVMVNINEVIENSITLLKHQAELSNVEIILDLQENLGAVRADSDQIEQVLINMMLNAIQAMSEGGALTLKTRNVPGDKYIEINVGDTGYGISKENLSRLFTPFFTTKTRERGVGLGLAVVHGIIQKHRGNIEVKSEEGKGTTFTIHLEVFNEQDGPDTGS
ncbi:MAG: ATP-binding protein [Chloroflexi bacterium]|nr:ATP-binding protein [Chloroflexota bacterium]